MKWYSKELTLYWRSYLAHQPKSREGSRFNHLLYEQSSPFTFYPLFQCNRNCPFSLVISTIAIQQMTLQLCLLSAQWNLSVCLIVTEVNSCGCWSLKNLLFIFRHRPTVQVLIDHLRLTSLNHFHKEWIEIKFYLSKGSFYLLKDYQSWSFDYARELHQS